MKRLQILAMAAVLVLGISSLAVAEVSAQNPFGFYVYDTNNDQSVSLSLGGFSPYGTLEYSTDGGNWNNFTSTVPITLSGNATSQLIQFHLLIGPDIYTFGTIEFGGEVNNGLWHSATLNFYNSITNQWLAYTVGTAGGSDSIGNAPTTTPIPAAAWLLGSGLLGLIGIGKRGYFGNA
jgi:hypothetical protein